MLAIEDGTQRLGPPHSSGASIHKQMDFDKFTVLPIAAVLLGTSERIAGYQFFPRASVV